MNCVTNQFIVSLIPLRDYGTINRDIVYYYSVFIVVIVVIAQLSIWLVTLLP